jgi:hypothetical protein
MRVNFTVMNWLQKPGAEINPASRVTRMQSMNYCTVAWCGRNLSNFVALAADDLDIPVSCARRLNDLCGVCSNLALISYSFPQ